MTTDDLLWQHLKTLPAFRALLRAVEARFYQNIELPEPILDLGCGDGNFAELTFPDRTLTAGIDPWWNPLQKARRAAAHHYLLQSLGDNLPFPDNHFASIISNSVLEHIPDIQPVLREANRVMQPNGRLVITMPNHNYTNYLDGALFFEGLGLKGMADRYRRFFNFIARHAHTDSAERWAVRLAEAGFVVEQWQYYFSKRALHALEWGHVQGLPSAVIHALTGHWIIAPWESNLRGTERWVRPFYEEESAADGTMVLIIARKESRGPVEATLPPQKPVAIRPEPEEPTAPDTQPEPIPVPAVEAPERVKIEPFSDEPQADTAVSQPIISAATIQIGLLVLALLTAFLGQAALANTPPDTAAALPLFALTLLLTGIFTKFTIRNGMALSFGRFIPRNISRRRWIAVGGLLLSFIAYTLVRNPGASFNPAFAIYLWLIAAGLTIYALWPEQEAENVPLADQSPRPAWEIPAVIALTIAALIIRLFDLTGHPYILNGSEASIGLDALAVARGQIQTPFAVGWLTNPTLPFFILALPVQLLGPSALSVRLLPAVIGAATVPTIYFFGRRWLGPPVALLAAILLAGSHLHIHYSRLGLTNIWDPLLALLVFGLIYAAWQNGRRRTWLLAGLALGLTPYLFTTAHLFPFMLPLIIVALLWKRPYPPGYLRNLLAAAIVALVVALPQLLFYQANYLIFMDRANTLGIFQSNWFVEEGVRTGQNAATVLAQQFRRALFAFQGGQDTSNAYNPGVSLLPFWPAVFFTLGLALALWRLRQLRYQLLLIWLGVTLVTAAFLLQSPPSSHRLLIAVPAVYLLIALALGWLGQQFLTLLGLNKRYLLPVLTVLALFMGLSDLGFYFGQYRTQHRFGDRNTEIAYEMAGYLNSLDGDWAAHFYGPPNMYTGFPTFPFLLTDLGQGLTFTDIIGGEEPQPPQGNTVYLFIPERAAELPEIESLYPDGRLLTFEGNNANPLFYAYEIGQ